MASVAGCVVGVVAGGKRGASSWRGGEKTRHVDKVSDKTLVAIYSRTASKLRTNFVMPIINPCQKLKVGHRVMQHRCGSYGIVLPERKDMHGKGRVLAMH